MPDAPATSRSTSGGHETLDRGITLIDAGLLNEAVHALESAVATFVAAADSTGEAAARTNLGTALRLNERVAEAITEHERACQLFQRDGDRLGEAQAWGNLGSALAEAERFPEAVSALEAAVTAFEEVKDRVGGVSARTNLGTALLMAGRLEEAVAVREHTVESAGSLDRHAQRLAHFRLAAALAAAGRFTDAAARYDYVANLCATDGDTPGQVDALERRARALSRAGAHADVIPVYRRLAELAERAGDQQRHARISGILGVALCRQGDFVAAVGHLELAERGQESASRREQLERRHYLGVALLEVGRPEDAASVLADVVQSCRPESDGGFAGEVHNNLGAALHELRRFAEAAPHYKNAQGYFAAAGNVYKQGLASHNLSDVLIEIRHFVAAIGAAEEAERSFAATGQHGLEGEALLRHGEARLLTGQRQTGISVLRRAQDILRTHGDAEARAAARELIANAEESA